MFCKKCGNKLPENSKFCPSCGDSQEVVVQEPVATKPAKDNNKLANTLSTISVCLYFGVPLLSYFAYFILYGVSYGDETATTVAGFFSSFISLFSMGSTLAAYILMIIARVKCPSNTFAKVLMWVYIALFAMGLITLVVMMVACAGIIASCSEMGMIMW
jgi:hypothetical protein